MIPVHCRDDGGIAEARLLQQIRSVPETILCRNTEQITRNLTLHIVRFRDSCDFMTHFQGIFRVNHATLPCTD